MSEFKRELRERHIRALLAIARSDDGFVSSAKLADVVGGYAANTIKSLIERELIRPMIVSDRRGYGFTQRGSHLAAELLHERAS